VSASDENRPPALVWHRERQVPRRQVMSVERIVEAALRIADAEGLDAVSMRRVATELNSGTTSLYRHVASRDELLDLMIDSVQGDPLPELSGDWRADLAGIARRLRTVLLRHPWIGAVQASRPALGPNALRQMDYVLTAATSLTPDITVASNVMSLVMCYVFGAVSVELAEQEAQRRTGLTQEQWRAGVGPYLREVIASGAYPQFARRIIEADDLGPDQQFEFGLDCLLDGVAARVTRSAAPRGPARSRTRR
jgi:AcrR family transcriptional regulator